MPFDPSLAKRVRRLMSEADNVVERRMFGGLGFVVNGHLAAGAHSGGGLLVRCAKEDFIPYLDDPGAEPMLRGHRPVTGWIVVDPTHVTSDDALRRWVERGRAYAESLPPKVVEPKQRG